MKSSKAVAVNGSPNLHEQTAATAPHAQQEILAENDRAGMCLVQTTRRADNSSQNGPQTNPRPEPLQNRRAVAGETGRNISPEVEVTRVRGGRNSRNGRQVFSPDEGIKKDPTR